MGDGRQGWQERALWYLHLALLFVVQYVASFSYPPPRMYACPRRMYSYRLPLHNNNTSTEPIHDLEMTYSTS